MNRMYPPGPEGNFLLGNMREFNANTLAFLDYVSTYGDIASIRFGPFRLYFVNHPELAREVLVAQASKFRKATVLKRALQDVIGDNIFTGDGEFWKRQRRLMQPAFHSKRIGAYADTMVAYTQRMMNDWEDGAEIDVDHAMTSLTMQIVTKTLFDADVSEESAAAGEAMTTLFSVVNRRFEVLLSLPTWVPTVDNRAVHAARAQIESIIRRIIEERRHSGEDHGDLLSMLLMAEDEDGSRMDEHQILREAITIFGAGHETTANTMIWTWYLLSQYQYVMARLQQEVDEVLEGRAPKLTDLENLPYTEMIIKESMRLYPPAWAVSRDTAAAVELGGYVLPPNSPVMIPIWNIHHDARWFPHPLRFEPERFSAERESNIERYAYIPFGAGPRVCIGNSFAMMEARLILATIAQRFDFLLAPGQTVEAQRVFTLRPRYGMRILLRERKAAPIEA